MLIRREYRAERFNDSESVKLGVLKSMPRCTKPVLIVALFFIAACLVKPAVAGVIVSVDWDATLDNGIQSSIVANPGDTVTATIVFTITGSSSVSNYEISTRFSSSSILFVSRTDTGPATLPNAPPSTGNTGPVYNIQSTGLVDPIVGLYGVNEFIAGTVPSFGDPGPTATSVPNPFAVSAITFTVLPGASGMVLIPGLFNMPGSLDLIDDNTNSPIPLSELTFVGGSITAVPEPSAIALVTLTLAAFGLRRYRKRDIVTA
jgi:hypothetical protein